MSYPKSGAEVEREKAIQPVIVDAQGVLNVVRFRLGIKDGENIVEALDDKLDHLKAEKERRVRYQDIVYAVCNMVDRARGDHGTDRCSIGNVLERLQEKI